MLAEDIFGAAERKRLSDAIGEAEKLTSGEIRVHIDDSCSEDVLDRAAFLFEELEMHKTELRNGVLFYIAFRDRKFAILGDAGINAKVPEGFWNGVRDTVISAFKEGNYVEGLEKGLLQAGNELKHHYPVSADDVNELSNEISMGGGN